MKTILVTFYIVMTVPDGDEGEPVAGRDIMISAVEDAINQNLSYLPENLGLISTRTLQLDLADINSGQCNNCGQWTTDIEKPNPVIGIPIGARIEGRLFCDECLPSDHPHAF